MIYECQFCGKKYNDASEYAKCVAQCAIKYKNEAEVRNQKIRLLSEKEAVVKKNYKVLKESIDDYYNAGGTKQIKSSLKIDEKKDCGCDCNKSTYKYDSKWIGTTSKWFSIPENVKVSYYNNAKDLKKKKPTKETTTKEFEVKLEDLLKTILDIEEPKVKPRKTVTQESFYDNAFKDVWNFLDELAKKYDE